MTDGLPWVILSKFMQTFESNPINLSAVFSKLNEAHFDGFLDPPALGWNTRLRSSSGRFIPGSRKHWREDPARIEIASYLLEEENGASLVQDTMAHEMIHYWLWVRRRDYGHTAEFWSKMTLMGVSRYNPVPRKQSFKYSYYCKSCLKVYPARRKLGVLACADCCNRFSGGRFDPKFAIVPAVA